MVDKVLTEAGWKKFYEDRPSDDGPLIKALAAAEKAEKGGGPAFVEALEAVDKQIAAFRKGCKTLKADKELTARLEAMDKALDAALKEAQRAEKQAAEQEDEDESPALLTTKMIPLLREVRKGTPMHTLVALAGKEACVLVARRAIAPARRKMLAEQLGASSGIKYVTGQCIFEENAHTFVVQSQASGLAKKLKAALHAQTAMRLKVRVRGEDPADIDEDLEGDDDQTAEPGAATRDTAAEEAAAAALAQRLEALRKRLGATNDELTRLQVQRTPIAGDVAQRIDTVRAQIDSSQADAASAGIDQLDKIAQTLQARQAGGNATAAAAVIAAQVKELATRFIAVRATLDSLNAYKTPIGGDIQARVDDITRKLQAKAPEGVAKQLDQLDQIAKAIQARQTGTAGAAAKGEAKTQAREAADALLARLDAALAAERQRLAGLADAELKAPVQAQLEALERERGQAAQTAGDDARTAAQQKVLDAVPALSQALGDALATQALKQAYTSGRAAIAAQVDPAAAALKAARDRFKDSEANTFDAALKADQERSTQGRWQDASDGLATLKAAADALLTTNGAADAYQRRLTALQADIATAKAVVDGGLPDGIKRLATAWTDSAAEVDKCVQDRDWVAALAALEKRKTDVIDVLVDVDKNGKPVLAKLAALDVVHQRANDLLAKEPTHFTPAMQPAEQAAVLKFDTALAALNWGDAQSAVDELKQAIKDVLDAQTAWEAYSAELEKGNADRGRVEAALFHDGTMFPPGATDDYDDAINRYHSTKAAADWAGGLVAAQDLNAAAKVLITLMDTGAAYYKAMKAIGADMEQAYRVAQLGDSRLQAKVDELDRVLNEINNHVAAAEWDDAGDKVLELRDAARALIDANDGLSGRLDFEVALSKIAGVHQARALALRPPAGMAAALPQDFRKAVSAADNVRNAKDFATVAATTATVLADLKKATKDLLDADKALAEGRKAFDAEMKKITELAAARALTAAAPPALAAAVNTFKQADAAATLASSEGRWAAALTNAQTLATRTTELLAARTAANSAANDQTWPALQLQLEGLATRIQAALATSTVPFILKLQQGVLVPEAAAKAALAAQTKDRIAAEVALATLSTALSACEKGRSDHAAHLQKVKAAAEGEVKAAREARLGSEALNQLRNKELDVTAAEIKALADDGKIAQADKAVADWISEARAWLQSKAAFDTLSGGAVDKAKLDELNKLPGGGVVMDALVANLPDSTPQSVLKDAMQARYGIKVKQFTHKNPDNETILTGLTKVDKRLPDKSLKALYDMLGEVPMEHVKDKVKELVRFTENKGGASYLAKKVYMYCGRTDDPNATQQKFGVAGDVVPAGEKVEPGCEPADTAPVQYFKFAALHEVAHAEDDAKKYMDDPAMAGIAGWLKHSADEVAGVAAAHFKYDLAYVKAILADKSSRPPATSPAPPTGVDAVAWEQARMKVVAWCQSVRESAGLWWNSAGCKQAAIGGRVYHEAYANDWVSYNLAARAQGITAYQFRAPGEWFAELYAAYYCKKLKPSHPAMAWLSKL